MLLRCQSRKAVVSLANSRVSSECPDGAMRAGAFFCRLFQQSRVPSVYAVKIAEGAGKVAIEAAITLFDELTYVLGLVYNRKTDDLDSEVEALIEQRTAARKAKDFKTADAIRDKLKEMGIVLEDTREGVKWKRA